MFAVRLSSSKSNSNVSGSKTMFSITVPNLLVVAKISGSASGFRLIVFA